MASRAEDESGAPPMGTDAEKLLAEYLLDAELRLVPKTVLNYGTDVRTFLRWLGHLDPLAVGNAELKGFLLHLTKDREVGERAILRYYSALQSFYQYLEDETKVAKSPIP